MLSVQSVQVNARALQENIGRAMVGSGVYLRGESVVGGGWDHFGG